MSVVARLEDQALDASAELASLIEQARGDGAIVSFTGLGRPTSASGSSVERLILEHHPALTAQSLTGIAASAAERFDVNHIRIVHRCGEVVAGEPIVFAGAASRHRRAAFDCADFLMDELKTQALFWKREVGAAGAQWIEPTGDDYAANERWG